MAHHPRRHIRLAALTGLVVLLAPGCNRQPNYDKYIPSESDGRQALSRVLDAWKMGQSDQDLAVPSLECKVHVVDAQRRPGQRLLDYEILGEISADGPRSFAVRLGLANPQETLDVRYYLVGIDPLWVLRQEDYDIVTRWGKCEDEEESVNLKR